MVNLPEKAKKLIEGKNFANIATLMKNGSPHVTTTWIDHDDDTVLTIRLRTGSRQEILGVILMWP
jgi:general stress protein 26